MVSEPQSEGKENQQEETAAAAAAPTICTPAAPATARSSEKRPRAPESCVFPARLRAWLCSWGSGAHWGGTEPHCHPMTYSGLQQQSNSRLSHEGHGLRSNPQERPFLRPTNVHQLIQFSEEKWGPGAKTSGFGGLKEDIVPDFDLFWSDSFCQ